MQKLTHFRPEDVLTDVLRSVHVQGTLYCRSKMSVPWGFRVAHRDTASFHVVTDRDLAAWSCTHHAQPAQYPSRHDRVSR